MQEQAITQVHEPEAVEPPAVGNPDDLVEILNFNTIEVLTRREAARIAVEQAEYLDPGLMTAEDLREAAEAAGVDPGELARYIQTEAEEDPAVEALEPDLDRAG